MEWTPYRWEPVLIPHQEYRLTFHAQGPVDKMSARIDGVDYAFTIQDSSAELVLGPHVVDLIPDRAPAAIYVTTGGKRIPLCVGHVTRRLR